MYIEASSPRKQGDNAKIQKNGLAFSGNTCLRFFFHMKGSGIGTLNVFVGRDKVYEMTGAQEDLWKEANIKVSDVGIYPVSGLFIFKVKCLNNFFLMYFIAPAFLCKRFKVEYNATVSTFKKLVKLPCWGVLNHADSLCIKISPIFYIAYPNPTAPSTPQYGNYPKNFPSHTNMYMTGNKIGFFKIIFRCRTFLSRECSLQVFSQAFIVMTFYTFQLQFFLILINYFH